MRNRALVVGCLTIATLLWVVILSFASRRPEPTALTQVSGDGGTAQITLVDTSAFESSGHGEVRLRADLRDKSGVPVRGLSIDRIEVFEEGFPCRVDALDGPGTQPINVVLVIDTSGSMEEQGRIAAAREAAGEAVKQLVPGRDRAGLISFSNSFQIQVEFGQLQNEGLKDTQTIGNSIAPARLLGAIEGLTASGGTLIAEPTLAGVGMFGGKVDGAKIVIVMTDGEDPSLSERVFRIGMEAQKAGCKIFTIGFGAGVTPESEKVLKGLATGGNGQYYFAPDSATLARLYKEQVQEASEEFGISISSPFPQADGLERRLSLKVKSPFDGELGAESRYRVGSMISTVRAEPVQFGSQNVASAPADSGSGQSSPILLAMCIAGVLGGGYFLGRFLPAGDMATDVQPAVVTPVVSNTKKPLAPPPRKGSQPSSQGSPQTALPSPQPTAEKKLPPPPPRKR